VENPDDEPLQAKNQFHPKMALTSMANRPEKDNNYLSWSRTIQRGISRQRTWIRLRRPVTHAWRLTDQKMAKSLGLRMWKHVGRFRIHGIKGILSKHIQETEEETSWNPNRLQCIQSWRIEKGYQTTEFEVNWTMT